MPSTPLPEVRVDLMKVGSTPAPVFPTKDSTSAPTSVTTVTDSGEEYTVYTEEGNVVGMEPVNGGT